MVVASLLLLCLVLVRPEPILELLDVGSNFQFVWDPDGSISDSEAGLLFALRLLELGPALKSESGIEDSSLL